MSKVTVRKPDPSTGEVVERVVPADHFRPKPPQRPTFDPDRAPEKPMRTAAGCLYVLDFHERELAYWEAHANRLTLNECRRIARGRGVLSRPVNPGWKSGAIFSVSDFITAEVVSTQVRLYEYVITLRVYDSRPMYPRRNISAPPARRGAKQREDKGALAAARMDGNYTSSRSQAVPGTDEEVDVERHHMEGAQKTALHGSRATIDEKRARLESRIAEARRKGWRSTLRYLERQRDRECRAA